MPGGIYSRPWKPQGLGNRRVTYGTGAASDRTPVCCGGARQSAVAFGGAKVGVAPAGVGAGTEQAPPVSAGAAAGGSAEESVGRCGALCAESVGSAHTLSRRRRVGD